MTPDGGEGEGVGGGAGVEESRDGLYSGSGGETLFMSVGRVYGGRCGTHEETFSVMRCVADEWASREGRRSSCSPGVEQQLCCAAGQQQRFIV